MLLFSRESCPTLCDPMDCSTPDSPVLHSLWEFAQTHVHWIDDGIEPSHPLSPSSPPALSLSQHQLSHLYMTARKTIALTVKVKKVKVSITQLCPTHLSSKVRVVYSFDYTDLCCIVKAILQDQTSPSERKSVLNIHWKDWCWNSNTLATWCEELTQWKRPWCRERLKAAALEHFVTSLHPEGPSLPVWQELMLWNPCAQVLLTYCVRAQLCLTLCDPRDCSLPGSSVHGTSQARMLEWVAFPPPWGSSKPRDGTHASCIGRWILYLWANGEALLA